MIQIHFNTIGFAFLVALTALFYWLTSKKRIDQKPTFYIPNSDMLLHLPITLRQKIARFIPYLQLATLVFASLAMLDIHQDIDPSKQTANMPEEGIAILLLIDKSGSMATEIPFLEPNNTIEKQSKMNLLKKATLEFILGDPKNGLVGRPNDLIGIMDFARSAELLVPPTLNRPFLTKKLESIDVVTDPKEDGTAIGYAVFKAANFLALTRKYSQDAFKNGSGFYQIKDAVIVVVTDGFQSPNPNDRSDSKRAISLQQAADFAKSQNIRVNLLQIEPKSQLSQFASERRLLQKMVETTGGRLFSIANDQDLPSLYKQLDQMERGIWLKQNQKTVPHRTEGWSPFFISLSMLLFALTLLTECCYLRRAP